MLKLKAAAAASSKRRLARRSPRVTAPPQPGAALFAADLAATTPSFPPLVTSVSSFSTRRLQGCGSGAAAADTVGAVTVVAAIAASAMAAAMVNHINDMAGRRTEGAATTAVAVI